MRQGYRPMVRDLILGGLVLGLAARGRAQLGMFSKEQRIGLTREWSGERFADGRPKVPDSVLEQLKTVDAEEAWGVLQAHGYKNQFEPGWHVINRADRLVGRVFTAVFMPLRPDVNAAINDHGKTEGRVGAQNSWPIDMLAPGDVLVMPGDMAVSDPEGNTFIPPQLGQEVADQAQMTHMVDEWGHTMLRQGKYTPGQIDRKWTKEMIEEFNKWLEQKGSKLRMKEE